MCAWYVVFKGNQPGVYTSWLSAVSKYWDIMELCTRSTTRISKQWLLSTQLSTQSLLLNILPLLQNLHQHPAISYKSVVIFFLCCGLCDVDQAQQV